MDYNSYFVDGCEKKETFRLFLRALLANSDAFSLVFFRYKENEKPTKTVSTLKKQLTPFLLNSRLVTEWPGTVVRNEQGYIYRMNTYKASIDVLPILETVETLWDWNYPKYPMDPCFYKNRYVWFSVSAHEHWNTLYLNTNYNYPLVSDLESLGVSLIPGKKVNDSNLFINTY